MIKLEKKEIQDKLDFTLLSSIDGLSLDEIIQKFQSIKSNYPNYIRFLCLVEEQDDYYTDQTQLVLYGTRLETDDEYNRRLKRETDIAERVKREKKTAKIAKEENERKEYERLKQKFG